MKAVDAEKELCYDAVKIIQKRGRYHAEFSKYVSGSIYGNTGRNSFPLHSDQPAGNPGAEDLQESKIRDVCMELDLREDFDDRALPFL